jgi:phosphoribosylformimino-5-aminoimidazole carboxamide ribotide isomerase
MMAGTNLPAMLEMKEAVDIPVIASGGVTNVEDVRQLARMDMAGCIIGRALYERTLTIADAVSAAKIGGFKK